LVYTEKHRSHDPQFFLVRGVVKRTAEQPDRADRLGGYLSDRLGGNLTSVLGGFEAAR
jgi:hypothetical protein